MKLFFNKRVSILLIFLFFISHIISCEESKKETDNKKEIYKMFSDYFYEVNTYGLESESKYLSDSKNFFLIPPSYDKPVTKIALLQKLKTNQQQFDSVFFKWKNLEVFVLDSNIATYYGTVDGYVKDISGKENTAILIESGTVIKEGHEWKILTGHASVVE